MKGARSVSQRPLALAITENPATHGGLFAALPGCGIRVTLANDGITGYHKSQLLTPQLILLDEGIAKIESIALIRLLKGLPATASIPILYLTTQGGHEVSIAALRAGAVDCIGVPYAVEELIERIRIHLRLAREIKPGLQYRSHANHPRQPVFDGCAQEDRMLVHAAAEIIDERLSMPPTQAELSDMFNASGRKLSNAFRHCLGVSIAEYIRQRRMARAEYLLKNTALKLSAIADELGFSSPANFATAFRHHSGVSPRVFRHQHHTHQT